ncbi:MAG TPA: ATP-binding protein [Gammaproteobacteria bacterium]
MIPRSIGARLTLQYAAVFAVALLLLGGGIWITMTHSLYHAIDESLRDRVEGVRRFIADHRTRLDLPEVKEEFRAHGDLFQVLDRGAGAWLHRADGLRDAPAPALDAVGGVPRFDNVVVGEEPMRFISQDVGIDGHVYAVQAAAPLRDLREGLRNASWVLVPLFPLVLLAASAAGYWMSRRALAPVDEITAAAREITAANLSRRLAVPATGDELERLSRTLNEMIERLERSFRRIAQFTADASHELRTPLAVMRTTAEVALRGPEPPTEQRAALEDILVELERTSQLVENLLLLARADAGQERLLEKRPVDLAAAIAEAVAQAQVLARAQRVALEARLPERPLIVRGDAHALRRLFLILLDNAVKYTPAGGRVDVALAERGGQAVAAVRDTGIGIPPAHLPHIFERFYRVDPARSRRQGGAGLGLAIGCWIAAAHGGAITATSEPQQGSEFTVSLPLA